MAKPVVRSRLQEHCRQLLRARRHDQTFSIIAKELGFSHTFVAHVANDRGNDASAAKLERIYYYFTGKELSL